MATLLSRPASCLRRSRSKYTLPEQKMTLRTSRGLRWAGPESGSTLYATTTRRHSDTRLNQASNAVAVF